MKTLILKPLGLHLGYLGCYGNDWIATPNLDRIAAEGATFDRHFIETPDQPSHTIEDWLEGVLDQLTDAKAHWINGPNLGPPWNLPDDLLALYTEDDEVEPCPDPDAESATESDFLLRVQDTYAAAVTCFDAQVGRLLEEIDARGLAEKMLLIVTSGASLPLGEHGVIGWNDLRPYEALAHVPLLMRGPGVPAGTRIGAITQPADLLTTLSKQPGGFDLWPLLKGEVDAVRPHAVSRTANGDVALRTLDWALIRTASGSRLYVKPDDRWEVSDVASQHRELVESLEALC